MKWSTVHGEALQCVFDALNLSKASWLVLRNYEGLPTTNSAKDVDIGVSIGFIEEAFALVRSAVRRHGFDRVLSTRFHGMRCSTFFGFFDGEVKSIKIDLMDGFIWRGAPIFRFDDIYKNSLPFSDFKVPGLVDDGLMLLLKPLMTGGGVKQRYVSEINECVNREPNRFLGKMSCILGRREGVRSFNAIMGSGGAESLNNDGKRVALRAWCMAIARFGARTVLLGALMHAKCECARRISRRPGFLIAVLGPDGVGKSTFIEALRKEVVEIFVLDDQGVDLRHFRPRILPNLSDIFSARNESQKVAEFSSPHRAMPASMLSSLLRMVYYWLDYVFGYVISIRRKCARGRVVIFDRYIYDFLVDPRRSRINLPDWVRKTFIRLAPQPDLVFVMDGDPELIFFRKQELSKCEIERQLGEYRKLVLSEPAKFIRLDASLEVGVYSRYAIREIVMRASHAG